MENHKTFLESQKPFFIKDIKEIITQYGSFGSGEVEIGGETSSPLINEMGGLVALAEYFKESEIDVNVYEPASMSSDSMHSYTITYEELDEETLVKILELAQAYEKTQS